jgi:hypothetical protein
VRAFLNTPPPPEEGKAEEGAEGGQEADDPVRMPLRSRAVLSLVLGTLAFIFYDLSGYDRLTVDLFVPRSFVEVWWHFPLWVAGIFAILTLYRTVADDSQESGDSRGIVSF